MPDKPAQTWEQWLWNQGARIAGGAAGATLGGVAGGPIGAIAGGATGAAIGEDWAQQREVEQGVRPHVNPVSVFANAAATQIPGGTIGKVGSVPLRQVAARLPRAFLAGLPGGAAASAVEQEIETGTVDPWRTAMDAGFSSSIGTAMAAATHTAPVAAKRINRNEQGGIKLSHRSWQTFDEFNRDRSTQVGSAPEGIDRLGHWLTDNTDLPYGPIQYDVDADLKKPKVFTDAKGPGSAGLALAAEVKAAGGAAKYRAQLQADGFDGIHLQDSRFDGPPQNAYIVFEDKQAQIIARKMRDAAFFEQGATPALKEAWRKANEK